MSIDQVTLQERGPNDTSGQRAHNPQASHERERHVVPAGSVHGQSRVQGSASTTRTGGSAGSTRTSAGYHGERGAALGDLYNYRLRFDNGAPFQIEVFNNPVLAEVIVGYLGTYFQDSWTIAPAGHPESRRALRARQRLRAGLMPRSRRYAGRGRVPGDVLRRRSSSMSGTPFHRACTRHGTSAATARR